MSVDRFGTGETKKKSGIVRRTGSRELVRDVNELPYKAGRGTKTRAAEDVRDE